jgi:CysZ protein
MPAPVLSGPQYLREGLKLVLSPGLRLFVLLPLAINLVLFVGLIYFAGHQFSLWVDALMPTLPDWLSFLSYILWPLFVVLVVLMVFFTFTMLANIIAAPFNGFLAEKVEVVVRGTDDFPRSAGANWWPWCRAPWRGKCASWATSCHGPSACSSCRSSRWST